MNRAATLGVSPYMRVWTAVVTLLGLLAVAGCAAAADTSAGYDQADVRFNQQMIIHHRQTIQLAELAADRSSSSYVRELSKKLIAAEQADIQKMSEWLKSWQQPVPAEEPSQEATELRAGPGFDRGWLTVLSRHLEHGIHMAKEVQTSGKHEPTRLLADRIVREQGEELATIADRLD
ncbi:DUF305 domain-containing protein [Nonomuraea turcica]|uniref:DUF305 domain-containing protein n=1 Tax=Nonomuraea sp. G32 TaxID=3067274 RepID=UPI00273A8800|nr:DUF305 domain-containing protein [Nonomuraea sp. G32]MDP4505455.1 DUF305 domain-containing protein [Nonomuraea sp. G32]